MSAWTEQEANETARAITQRSITDMEFRQLCLSNPVAAVKAQAEKDLPEGFSVRCVENNGANLTVVLPDLIADSGELSDTELESVAGGGKGSVDLPKIPSCGCTQTTDAIVW
jgi:hypothetical protein